MIKLREQDALGKGHSRLVFQHPDFDDRVIKVIRPDVIDSRFGSGAKWYKRLRRFGHLLSFQRELDEYLAVRARVEEDPAFIHKIYGFEETSFGLGLVSQAVKDADGQLAPTLGDLLKEHQYNEKVEAALEECLALIADCPIIVSDLNVGNFVYLKSENRFILIDGMGNANLLPFKPWFPAFNRRSKLKRYRRFRNRIERYKAQYKEG